MLDNFELITNYLKKVEKEIKLDIRDKNNEKQKRTEKLFKYVG